MLFYAYWYFFEVAWFLELRNKHLSHQNPLRPKIINHDGGNGGNIVIGGIGAYSKCVCERVFL